MDRTYILHAARSVLLAQRDAVDRAIAALNDVLSVEATAVDDGMAQRLAERFQTAEKAAAVRARRRPGRRAAAVIGAPRRCPKCHKDKPAEEFIDKRYKGGQREVCLSCMVAAKEASYAARRSRGARVARPGGDGVGTDGLQPARDGI